MEHRNYVTVREAATQCGITPQRVRQLVKEGRVTTRPYNGKSYDVDLRSLQENRRTTRPYQRRKT